MKRLSGVFESDPAPVVADKLRARTATLLAGTAADPDAVAGHLGLIVGIETDTEAADRDALFHSVREFVEALAREQPTILVFEDVHWADANMLDLVHALAIGVRGLPVLFVTLARPELLDQRGHWGAGLPGYTSITLGPLDDADARQLAARLLSNGGHVDEVIRVAEGNPLFIEQLAASVGELAPGKLPTNIREIVAARLDALPAAERALVLDAAVVGKLFWVDALRAMGADGSDVTGLLEALERRDLIRREPSSIIEGQQQLAFTHSLIRDVAYDLLPRADRARRHALVAEFFGSHIGSSGEAIGALARHWRDAGDYERAVEHLTRAAEIAERGWAKDHAARLYRQAFELVPESETDQRNALRRRLALASSASFHVADVRPGEVRGRDVADDLVERVDLVLSKPARMRPHELLGRSRVDAKRPDQPGVVDDDMAVLPRDVRELPLDDLPRAPADHGHVGLAHVEAPNDHVPRHARDTNVTAPGCVS